MCRGAVVLDVPTSPAVLDVPWRGGAPGWRLRAAVPLGRLRARALTGAAVVVLSGKLRLVVVVLVVMLVTP